MIIGICGGSCSGKSTLARELLRQLGSDAVLISHDSYYLPRTGLSPEQKKEINYDHPSALETGLLVRHLKKLRAGEGIDCPVYDYTVHDRAKETVQVLPAPFVLLDGILIYENAQLRELMDYKIFVDVPLQRRMDRRVRRDQRQRGREKREIIQQFRQTVQPMHEQYVEPCKEYADVIVNGQGNCVLLAEELCGQLRAFWKEGKE